jgi:hypothetical protein
VLANHSEHCLHDYVQFQQCSVPLIDSIVTTTLASSKGRQAASNRRAIGVPRATTVCGGNSGLSGGKTCGIVL